MTNEEKLRRIEKLYRHESEYSAEITIIDKKIRDLMQRRRKLCRNISGAAKYRNTLIHEAYTPKSKELSHIENVLATAKRLGCSVQDLRKMDYMAELEITKRGTPMQPGDSI